MPKVNVRPSAPLWMQFPLFVLLMATFAALVTALDEDPWRRAGPSDLSRCETQLRHIAGALDMWILAHRRLPERGLQALLDKQPRSGERFLQSEPVDPWGNPIRFEPSEKRRLGYRLTSAGEDGRFDTDDDLVYPRMGE